MRKSSLIIQVGLANVFIRDTEQKDRKKDNVQSEAEMGVMWFQAKQP